jgi:DNA-binding MarR family transcriptional regulator
MSCDPAEIDPRLLAEMARTCACFNFRKASRSVTQHFDQILAPTGIRSTQLVILITGLLLGPSSIARLARELVMDRSTLTRNLKPLLNLGLVTFVAGPGKHKNVEVTPTGRSALIGAGPYWTRAQGQLVERFGDEAWNRLVADLNAVIDATRDSDTAELLESAD